MTQISFKPLADNQLQPLDNSVNHQIINLEVEAKDNNLQTNNNQGLMVVQVISTVNLTEKVDG